MFVCVSSIIKARIYCPDNASIAKIKLLIVKMLHGMCVYSMSLKRKGSLLMKICSVGTFLLGRLFPSNLKFKWLDNVSQWGNNKPSKYVKIYNDQYFALKSSYPSAIMDIQRCIRMQFEDITVNGLAEYDSYLKLIYGDYMTPPELSKRSPQHIRQ